MSRSPLLAAVAMVGLALVTPTAYAAPGPVHAARSSACLGRGPVPAAALVTGLAIGPTCDLTGRVVVSGDARVVVPPPGQGVAASGIGARGEEQALVVENTGGWVRARSGSGLTAPGPTAPGSTAPGSTAPGSTAPGPTAPGSSRGATAEGTAAPLPACADPTFKLYGASHHWDSTLRWRYNRAGEQRSLGHARILEAIRRGGHAMAVGRNDCHLSPAIDAHIGYAGSTEARPTIKGTARGATCLAGDTDNVVGWGRIGGDSLGWTCVYWSSAGTMIGADISLKASPVNAIGVPRHCTFRLDLRSLVTHEWGHAFGLDHIGNAHANLVMPHAVEVCSTSDRTLGLGDYLGMKKLYGTVG